MTTRGQSFETSGEEEPIHVVSRERSLETPIDGNRIASIIEEVWAKHHPESVGDTSAQPEDDEPLLVVEVQEEPKAPIAVDPKPLRKKYLNRW